MRGSEVEPPFDGRTIARRLGALLVIVGALFLGFVAFRLWGTGIEHANAQRELRAEFEQSLADTGLTSVTTTAATDSTTPPRPVPLATSPTMTWPSRSGSPTKVRPSSPPNTAMTAASPVPPTTALTTLPATTAPPTTVPPTTVPSTTVPPTTVPPRPVLAAGDPVLRLEIPRIGVDEIAVEGVGVEELKKGPGHYLETPLPGEPGNAAIAGHRTTYGAPFFRIDELAPGDEIITTTFAGRFVYRVTGTVIVPSTEVSVIAATSDVRLTLTSCHPRYSAAERMVVSALLDPEVSAPLATTPPTVPEETPPPTTEPPTTAATTAPPSTTADPSTAVASGPTSPTTMTSTTSSTTSTSTATTTATVDPPEGGGGSRVPLADVFGGGAVGGDGGGRKATPPALVSSLGTGWFEKPGAMLKTLLWGGACVAVTLAVRLVSRRFGHRLLLIGLGAIPFAVALFFFYANLNGVVPSGV